MEGYIAALLFGGAAFAVPQVRRQGIVQRLSVYTLYAATGLSLLLLLVALSLEAWVSAAWGAGLLAGSLGVIGRQRRRDRWLWRIFDAAAAQMVSVHYRSGLGWVLFGDMSLGITACLIGWSCLTSWRF